MPEGPEVRKYADALNKVLSGQVIRRTNLPCLRCGEIVRQLRQSTTNAGEEERSRIMYFCPNCQNVKLPDGRRKGISTNVECD